MNDIEKVSASVATGPKGGVEFRLWTERGTFRVVSRYVAWPLLSEADRTTAKGMILERRAKAKAKRGNDAAWQQIMRGG